MIDIRQCELFKGLLTNEEIWDVATALRGPDEESTPFKKMFTARIRWFALPESARDELRNNKGLFDGFVKVRTTSFVFKKDIDDAIKAVASNPNKFVHYLEHIVAAVDMMLKVINPFVRSFTLKYPIFTAYNQYVSSFGKS